MCQVCGGRTIVCIDCGGSYMKLHMTWNGRTRTHWQTCTQVHICPVKAEEVLWIVPMSISWCNYSYTRHQLWETRADGCTGTPCTFFLWFPVNSSLFQNKKVKINCAMFSHVFISFVRTLYSHIFLLTLLHSSKSAHASLYRTGVSVK